MNIGIIKELLDRYITGNASETEQKLVEAWLDNNEFPENDWSKLDDENKAAWMNDLYKQLNKTIQNINPLYKSSDEQSGTS